MRRVVAALCGLVVVSCGLGMAPTVASQTAGMPTPYALGQGGDSPIQHVVVIYQENHSFDDLLGQVCQERATPCDGYTGPVTFADGATAENVVEPDLVPEVDHSPYSQNLGLHDAWDGIEGCTEPPYPCVTHADPADIPNLTTLADTFTVSDATFAAGHSASFGAHIALAAGTIDGYVGNNPVPSHKGIPPRAGWGCPSDLDAKWAHGRHKSYQPSCVPDQEGDGPYRPSKVPYVPTIMERLEAAGLTWRIYLGESQKPSRAPLSFCTYFYWCFDNRFERRYNTSRSEFVADAEQGTLPSVSFLIPIGDVSQHNGLSLAEGDNYIGDMVSAVENGPEWDSTAIFITYDDCGCFYDHVTPPSLDLGLRNPMVIVSPYAKQAFTDSTTAVQPYSVLSFVEQNFGLGKLSKGVQQAYDYSGSFDFSQHPQPGPVMTHQTIPQAERRWIAAHLDEVEDDDT